MNEFVDLTAEEMDELKRERFNRRATERDWSYLNEPAWSPSEARWYARLFISKNQRGNLVRMLAEAYITLQDSTREEK